MYSFSGDGGSLYRLGDPLRFTGMLEDCGDGFDWRMADPALRLWAIVPDFEVETAGGWLTLEPLSVWCRSGRAAFGICLRGRAVRARGSCLPASLAGAAEGWRLEVAFSIEQQGSLGADLAVTPVPRGQTVRLEGCRLDEERVLVVLPVSGTATAFVGCGDTTANGSGSVLVFDEEGAQHVPC